MAYTDDLVLMAEEKQGMKEVMTRLVSYMGEKRLELYVRKTMVMKFRKG